MANRRSLLRVLGAASALGCSRSLRAPGPLPPQIDAGFPGGNIIVDRFAGDDVYLRQDLRDTRGHWFYWHFRVRGAAGRTLTFHFTNGDVIGARGPACSTDGGATWRWLGGTGPTFRYSFGPDAADVRFCVAIPYQERDLRRFLDAHRGHPHLRETVLCRTRKGRSVERLALGRLDGGARHRALITARHHACESLASHVLEGLMHAVLTDAGEASWLRTHAELMVIPLVDKDGVEDGDQGKNRRPRDHNRDYDGTSIHPAPAALRTTVPAWSEGRLRLALDLHCPGLRGAHNETIYFVGSPDQIHWGRVLQFARLLETTQRGELRYRGSDNLPFGTAWNTSRNTSGGRSFASWARAELPGVTATTLEIAYANANGQEVTAANARSFGRDLARAIALHLTAAGPA